jgi:hypothetical protein
MWEATAQVMIYVPAIVASTPKQAEDRDRISDSRDDFQLLVNIEIRHPYLEVLKVRH